MFTPYQGRKEGREGGRKGRREEGKGGRKERLPCKHTFEVFFGCYNLK